MKKLQSSPIALKCMVCSKVFCYCVNGVRLGVSNLPAVYNIGFSVCDECTNTFMQDPKQIKKACKAMGEENERLHKAQLPATKQNVGEVSQM